LKHPTRAPDYRLGREHGDFVTRLRDVVPSREVLLDGLAWCLEKEGFRVVEGDLGEAEEALERNTLTGSRVLEPSEYAPALDDR